MAKGNNALLIFDFDNTITNGHMHNAFSRLEKSDFNSGAEYAVTDNDIEGFMKEKGGIKNEETLKSVLQSALSSGMEVNIASYTGYPNAVKRVVENHLGLSKKQAGGISVFGGFPADYDTKLPRSNVREQQNQVGKNLHICRAIVGYKNKHDGQLPKTVMLVDDSVGNIKKINEFVESMSKREGWLKENGLSIEDIQKIKFEGVLAPINKEGKVVGDTNYLEKVQEFISANLVQESIYENLKKEEPIYQNLQGIHGSSSEKELSPPLPPKKRKSSDGIVVDDENKKPAYTQTFSLAQEFKAIKLLFKEYGQKIVDAICNLFKKEVITKIEGEGYDVNSKENEGIVVRGSKPIDAQKIDKYIASSLTETMVKNKENIKSLGNNYKGKQLEQKALESLEGNL